MFFLGTESDGFPFFEVDYHAPFFKSKTEWHFETDALIEVFDLLLICLENLAVMNHIESWFIAIS